MSVLPNFPRSFPPSVQSGATRVVGVGNYSQLTARRCRYQLRVMHCRLCDMIKMCSVKRDSSVLQYMRVPTPGVVLHECAYELQSVSLLPRCRKPRACISRPRLVPNKPKGISRRSLYRPVHVLANTENDWWVRTEVRKRQLEEIHYQLSGRPFAGTKLLEPFWGVGSGCQQWNAGCRCVFVLALLWQYS